MHDDEKEERKVVTAIVSLLSVFFMLVIGGLVLTSCAPRDGTSTPVERGALMTVTDSSALTHPIDSLTYVGTIGDCHVYRMADGHVLAVAERHVLPSNGTSPSCSVAR